MDELTPESKQILKSDQRKMKMFYAIDNAFANVNNEFDETNDPPSFQEMYDAINMLHYKIQRLELDARFAYNMAMTKKPNVKFKGDSPGVN